MTKRVCECLALVGILVASAEAEPAGIGFRKHIIDESYVSEAAAVADMNNDGKPDLVAGAYWWEAPDWNRHRFRDIADRGNPDPSLKYHKDELYCFADDLDADGDTDILTVHGPNRPVRWYENPGGPGEGTWKSHVVGANGPNESVVYADLDGDSKRELVMTAASRDGSGNDPGGNVAFYARPFDPTRPWTEHVIGAVDGTVEHGLGVGDVNDDGRLDVLVDRGWYEAPESPGSGAWTFHSLAWLKGFFLADCFDVDGDGDTDLISTSPHGYGVWWWEKSRSADGSLHFRKRTIDDSVSQTHSRVLVDLDGDGVLDYITGKRYYAANGADPGAHEPAVLAWYRIVRDQNRLQWQGHLIDTSVGPGVDFAVTDIDGDGDRDIFVAGKKGVCLYERVPREELYEPLFNGRDLSGWVGDTKHWGVSDGMIVGTHDGSIQRNSFLFTKESFADFELVLQCRMIGGVGNSGVQFRSEPGPEMEAKGYQADLGDGWWGSLYHEHGRGMLVKNERIDHLDRDGWMTYRIRAVGAHVQLFLDGVKTVDLFDPEGEREGRFALQLHTGPAMTMQFRDIRVRRTPPHVAPADPPGVPVPAWWIAGPFPNDEQEDEGFTYANPPESGFDRSAVMLGKGEVPVRWQRMSASDAGYVDLTGLIGQQSSAYAFCYVYSPEPQDVILQMGSDDGIRVWLNEALVHSHFVDRGAAPNQDHVHVRLQSGRNRLLVKIAQNLGGTGFYFHVAGKRKVDFKLEQ